MTFSIPRKTYILKVPFFSFPSFILMYIKNIVKVAVTCEWLCGSSQPHTTNGNIKTSNPTKFERANDASKTLEKGLTISLRTFN